MGKKMDDVEIRLVKFAFSSRIVLIFLQILFNYCVQDHNAGAFQTVEKESKTVLDSVILFLFEGFSRWDAQYFLHIARFGYTYENTLAFFPLYPVVVCQPIKSVLLFVTAGLVSDYQCSLVVGVCANIIFFVLSTVLLYKLSCLVFHSKEIAFVSALLFSMNPASIFFSSCYSESVFSFTVFLGLWLLEKNKLILAVCAMGLSACTRSNGILLVGFIMHARARRFFSELTKRKSVFTYCITFIVHLTLAAAYVFLCVLPFIAYQAYTFMLYCTTYTAKNALPLAVRQHAENYFYRLPSDPSSPWCFWTLPLSYTYVQDHYWSVGFMKYYSWRQIPNFILALPVLCITISSCIKYFVCNKTLVLCLGLRELKATHNMKNIYVNERCFVYFVHMFLLSLFCTFFIHVQVSTRLLASSSPVLYWIVASVILSGTKRGRILSELANPRATPLSDMYFLHECASQCSRYGRLCYGYFLSYFIVGTLLHVNHLPWT